MNRNSSVRIVSCRCVGDMGIYTQHWMISCRCRCTHALVAIAACTQHMHVIHMNNLIYGVDHANRLEVCKSDVLTSVYRCTCTCTCTCIMFRPHPSSPPQSHTWMIHYSPMWHRATPCVCACNWMTHRHAMHHHMCRVCAMSMHMMSTRACLMGRCCHRMC